MVFKCQEDSFLKSFTTKVILCEPASLEWSPPKETQLTTLKGFNVICEDTILFPEGGGQPCDYGTINGKPVRNVVRRGTEAVHFVEADGQPFEEGAEVKQILDWDRRLEHMQQHSGQHLITALFDQEFNYNTTSWWLGSEISYIELDTQHLISRESLDLIEKKANDLIREGRKVSVFLVDPNEAIEFQDARAPRGLPKDHVGLARVVRIEDIESNMCCGTHVSNLAQLQCVKLLKAEKAKGAVYVHFLIGQRVLSKIAQYFAREEQLNEQLKGGPGQHLELIQKLQSNLKNSMKSCQKVIKELAVLEAARVEDMQPPPKYYSLHRSDGIQSDFINTFLRYAPENIFYFLTNSEQTPKGSVGQIVLRGDPELIKKYGLVFLELLDGKGNGKGNNFQGKINNIKKIPDCEALLEEHFKTPKAVPKES